MSNPHNWRISSDGTNWMPLIVAGIGVPSLSDFRGHSVTKSRSEGAVGKYGYRRAEILWQKMTREQANALHRYVTQAGSGLLYMTIDRIDGQSPGQDWMDISGFPNLSDLSPTPPMLFLGSHTHQNVILMLNNVTIISTSPIF